MHVKIVSPRLFCRGIFLINASRKLGLAKTNTILIGNSLIAECARICTMNYRPTSWEDRLVQPWKDLGTSRTQIVMFPKKS